MAVPHDPSHELGQQHFNVKTWYYCGHEECYAVVCGSCRGEDCTCDMTDEEVRERNEQRLMRGRVKEPARNAQKAFASSAALAVWNDDEVACESTEEEEAPAGDTRPQEGHPDMAEKTEKKTTKKTTEKSSEDKVDKRTDAEARRGRGELESLVVEVTDAFEEGKVELPEGKTLTPQRIATIIGEKKGEDKPSPGAVAAILKRWDEAGYALTHEKPYAFKKVSARGKKQGLEDLKEKLREKKKADRKAEREAKKAEESKAS